MKQRSMLLPPARHLVGARLLKTLVIATVSLLFAGRAQAANRFWVAATARNWNSTAGWSATSGGVGGASIPGAADVVIFDGGGLGNCTMNVTVSIRSLTVNAGYTGNISQGANSITISRTATFAGGSFTGGSANLVVAGVFTLSGTIFISTTATLEFENNAAFTGGSFAHNNGTVRFNGTATGAPTLSGASPAFYIVEWVGLNKTYTISSSGNVSVINALNISGTQPCTINTGVFDVKGDINITNTATGGGGTATINLNGTGTQNFNGGTTAGVGALPQLTINNTAGAVNLSGFPSVANNFTYTAGAINAGASTFCFTRATTGAYSITGSVILNNISFTANTALTATIGAATTLTAGNLTIAGTANLILNTGKINVNGNITLTNTATGGGGTATLNIGGTADQTLDGGAIIANQSRLPLVIINKAGGTLLLKGNISFSANLTYTAGSIDPGTSTCNIVTSLTITGSFAVYDLAIAATANITLTITAGSTVTANNTLSLLSGGLNITINTGTLAVKGDIIDSNAGTGGGGTATLLINGTANQTITSAGVIDQGRLPAVTINKSSGTLIFPSLITVRGNWTYTTGALDLATNSSTVVFANTLTIAGTHSLNNAILQATGNYTYTVSTGTVLTLNGTLTTTGGGNLTLTTPVAAATAIKALGDILINNTGAAGGGTGAILISGTGAQALTSTVTAGQGRMPNVTIQKTSGTLTLTGIISESRNWTYSSGTVDAATNASTVVFGGNNLTITSAGMNFYHATVTSNTSTLANDLSVKGNLTINGTGVLSAGSNTINLGGNWTSRGTAGFTEATSTVNFNGSALQSITAPGGENFARFLLNNTGAGVKLINNATLATSLTMTQGNIDLNGSTLTLGLSSANKGTLARTSGTIINTGSFKRWFNTAVIPDGAIAGLFPVGTVNNYRPFYVSAPAAGPAAGGTITLTYTDATTNSSVFFPDGTYNVGIRKNLNWALSTANGLTGGSYRLRAEGTGFGTVGSVNDLRLTLANSTVGTAGTNAGTTTNPQVNRSGLSLANLTNTFYIGSVNPVYSNLPVSLLSFTATVENGMVRLDWATSAELNNDHFTIQRSGNSTGWNNVKTVQGAGNSSLIIYYSEYDPSPLPGSSYYRLMQTDIDGKNSYSYIRTVTLNKVSTLLVYPNPATNYITVETVADEKAPVALFNSVGQRMNVQAAHNGNKTTLYLSGMPAGVYFLEIVRGNASEIRKVIITK